jgi:hypothetical protein
MVQNDATFADIPKRAKIVVARIRISDAPIRRVIRGFTRRVKLALPALITSSTGSTPPLLLRRKVKSQPVSFLDESPVLIQSERIRL